MFNMRWILQELKKHAPTITVYHDGFEIDNWRSWRLSNVSMNLWRLSSVSMQLLGMVSAIGAVHANHQAEEYFKVDNTYYKLKYEKEKWIEKFVEDFGEPGNIYGVTITLPDDLSYEEIMSWDVDSNLGDRTVGFLYRALNQIANIQFEKLFDKKFSAIIKKEQSTEALQDLVLAMLGIGALCGLAICCSVDSSAIKLKLADWLRKKNEHNKESAAILEAGTSQEDEAGVPKRYGSIRLNN